MEINVREHVVRGSVRCKVQRSSKKRTINESRSVSKSVPTSVDICFVRILQAACIDCIKSDRCSRLIGNDFASHRRWNSIHVNATLSRLMKSHYRVKHVHRLTAVLALLAASFNAQHVRRSTRATCQRAKDRCI